MSMFEGLSFVESSETPNNEGNTTNTPINIVDNPNKSSFASKVWDHMVTVKLSGGQAKNKCKHCSKLLSVQKEGTTSHLLRHLRQACPARHKIFPQRVAAGIKSTTQSQLHVSQSTLQRVLRKHQAVRSPSPVNKRSKSNDSVEHENKDSRVTMEQKGVCPLSGGLVDGLASGAGVIQCKKESKITSQDHAVEGLDTVTELKSSHPTGKKQHGNDSVEHENKDSRVTMEQKGVCPLSGGLVDGLASGSGVIQCKKESKITSQDHAVEGLDTVTALKSSHPTGKKQHVVEIQNVVSDVACDQIQNVVVENNVRNLIVKARYKDDFIKFLLSTSSKFEELQREVIKRLKLQVGSFSMKYLDEDKDWIITSCDDDLQVAVYSCLSTNATVMHMLIQEI